MVSNPFIFPFDFYSALFEDLCVICLSFGLCLRALKILSLHGCWFGLQICVISTYILLDIVIGLIWIYLIFVYWDFLSVWMDVLALYWECKNMGVVGAVEAGHGQWQIGDDRIGNFLYIFQFSFVKSEDEISLFVCIFMWVFCEGWELGYFLASF